MSNFEQQLSHVGEGSLATNKVLRNTYLLLSMTLLFSAFTAGIAMALNIPQGAALVLSLVAFGMIFWINKVADTSQGLIAVFAFTGCMGAALGPMLNHYLALANGPMVVMQALGGTALIFLTLSGYVLTSRKDFSFLSGFLFTGLIVVVVAMLLNLFFQIPVLSLALSGAIVLLMSGFILFDTSRIIHGGETNYIRATVSLYLNIYNLFTSLLHILGVVGGDD
ncbi:MAG: Bax inhibitor-1/YccA family protein [Pseudomonadota bacterium]